MRICVFELHTAVIRGASFIGDYPYMRLAQQPGENASNRSGTDVINRFSSLGVRLIVEGT